MNKSYKIILDEEIIGETKFEKADSAMGIVFGKIVNSNNRVNYEFIKSYCKKKGIALAFDDPEDKLLSTRTIENLKVISPESIEIKGVGNQISGMDSEGFEITIEGIAYPFYEEEFPHHVKEYKEKIRE